MRVAEKEVDDVLDDVACHAFSWMDSAREHDAFLLLSIVEVADDEEVAAGGGRDKDE